MNSDIRTPCQNDPETWFENGIGHIEKARLLCQECPVITLCLREALRFEGGIARGMRHGVWGGTTPQERHNLYKQRLYAVRTGGVEPDCPGGRVSQHLAAGEDPCPRCAGQLAAA
jgi:hypothetical protein